jgi:thiol-disulfide isomerase/thioredoxin
MNSPSEPAAATGGPVLDRKTRLALAALVVLTLAALFWPRGETGTKAPGATLYDAGGQAAKLGPQLAPVTLVHFWATWCPPCIQEIPALQRLTRDFAGQHDFTIVMVAVSDSADKVRTFLGASADGVLFDPKWEVANRYGTEKLPETYLVVNGQVVRKFIGMTDWDNPELRQELESHLKSSNSTAALLPPGT